MTRPLAIVRAYGDEPLRRVIMFREGRLIYVAAEEHLGRIDRGESEPVGFPMEDVFAFDSELYELLAKEADTEKRKRIWSTAKLAKYGH